MAFLVALALGVKAQTLTANDVPEGIKAEDYTYPETEQFVPPLPKDADICNISFENATGLYVDVWIDKAYKGRITPWKRMSMKLVMKDYDVYFRTSGGTYQWYSAGDCESAMVLELDDDDE